MSELEPDANDLLKAGKDCAEGLSSNPALYSIAISMKRIADEVCGVPYDPAPGADNSTHSTGLVDGIMHAIEQGLLAGSQRG